MPQKTPIQWTDYTSNPIRARHKVTGKVGHACIKVSDGCKNCYAERMNKWRGTGEPFTPAGMANVELFLDDQEMHRLETFKPRGPFKAGGDRAMVFPFDMTDLFQEDVPSKCVQRFLRIVRDRRDIIWQVLTKRPHRVERELKTLGCVLPNLWLGTSGENQFELFVRMSHLVNHVRRVGLLFLSIEPMLGPISMDKAWLDAWAGPTGDDREWGEIFKWVIVGGESGRGKGIREMEMHWARRIRDDCEAGRVAFFMKQLGARPVDVRLLNSQSKRMALPVLDSHGGIMDEWPEDLRVRQWPRMEARV